MLGSVGAGFGLLGVPQTTFRSKELEYFAEDVVLDFEAERIVFPDYFDPDYEPGMDMPSPEEYVESQVGDCDDYATMIGSVADIKGYDVELAAGVLCYVQEGERVAVSHMNAGIQEGQGYICDINRFETLMTSFDIGNKNSSNIEFHPVYTFEPGRLARAEIDGIMRILDKKADKLIDHWL